MNNKEITFKVIAIVAKTKEILCAKDAKVDFKEGVGNIVTNIDVKVEQYIKISLINEFPNSQIVAEETSNEIDVTNDGLIFVIDPIDGTSNFTNGWPHTVSVGIIKDDELIGGVIFDVLNNIIYAGINGYGVIECSADDIQNIKMVETPKYDKNTVKKAIVSYDTPYNAESFELTQKFYSELYHAGASLKTVGPISLDVLKTALGKENRPHDYNNAVFHVEVRAWDLAAATCILRELGGEIIGKDGKPLSIKTLTSPTEKIGFIASGNKNLLVELLNLFKPVVPHDISK